MRPISKFNFTNESVAEKIGNTLPVIDLRFTTPERNFSCDGEAWAVNTIYEDTLSNNVVWQPDVLWEARKLADRHRITRVIDIGCGNGEKLVHHFPENEYDTVGLDFGGSLSLCRTHYPTRQWMECDLTSHDDFSRVSSNIKTDAPTIFILSDVIEHLVDLRPLMAWVRGRLMTNPTNRLVVSTPDRLRLGYQSITSRPQNKAHVREWSLEEMERYFASAGFQIIRSGHTRANQFDTKNSSIFIEAACSRDHYREFLVQTGLLHGHEWPRHLLVTTEYAGFHNTGGIGTFIREQRETYGYDETLCLFAGGAESLDQERMRAARLVSPTTLLDLTDIEALPLEDKLLKAVQQLLFYFPDIQTVQYGDYQGVGCRIAQAKRAGMFPQQLMVIVHCHGLTHYLENAHESWFGASHFGIAEKEKISVEKADLATFPTSFLRVLYAEAGITVSGETVMLRYPYHSSIPVMRASTKIDTLIFYGKRSRMKGYDIFLHVLTDGDIEEWKANGIRTITLIGPRLGGYSQNDKLLAVLQQHFQVEELTDLSRQQASDAVYDRAHRAVCVMPYLADNHPYALLDVAFSTALPLMVRAGGVAEIFPGHFQEILLANADITSIRERILYLLAMPADAMHTLRSSFVSAMSHAQEGINERVKVYPTQQQLEVSSQVGGEATVIVPVFNTPLQYIRDLIFGINNQTLKPAEVIFVDDASEESYGVALIHVIGEALKVPHRIIRHDVNQGLAGARNTGVSATSTEFIINIDSDDVPLNDFVRDIVGTLRASPEYVAAVPYLSAFDDGTDFNRSNVGGYVYRPLGDGVIASQVDNLLGHANAGFRTEAVREFGGWDKSSKSMWEDWALYLRFASAGRKIAVIPKVGCLYRVRPESMLRTYEVWPAMRRLASNMVGLPRYENFRLQATMRSYRDLVSREAEFMSREAVFVEHIHTLERELNRRSVRAVRSIATRIARHQLLFRATKVCGSITWRLGRGFIRVVRAFGERRK